MTRSAPDWFGPDDPEMQREFLQEIRCIEMALRYGQLAALRRETERKFNADFAAYCRPRPGIEP